MKCSLLVFRAGIPVRPVVVARGWPVGGEIIARGSAAAICAVTEQVSDRLAWLRVWEIVNMLA
jgi:hypothetical protein